MPRTQLMTLARSLGSALLVRPAVMVPVAMLWLVMAVTLLVRSPVFLANMPGWLLPVLPKPDTVAVPATMPLTVTSAERVGLAEDAAQKTLAEDRVTVSTLPPETVKLTVQLVKAVQVVP